MIAFKRQHDPLPPALMSERKDAHNLRRRAAWHREGPVDGRAMAGLSRREIPATGLRALRTRAPIIVAALAVLLEHK